MACGTLEVIVDLGDRVFSDRFKVAERRNYLRELTASYCMLLTIVIHLNLVMGDLLIAYQMSLTHLVQHL